MADEELKLTIKLDDQASAAIAALQAQLQQLGNVATQAGSATSTATAPAARQARANQQAAREAAQEMRGMSYAIGFIGGAVGGAVSEITKLGLSFLARATDIKAYSQAIVDLNAKSSSMGTSTAQLKANLDALTDAGVPKDEALRQLETFNNRLADLDRIGSAASRELLEGDTTGEMMELRNKIITQKEEDAYRTVVEFARRQRDLEIERGAPPRAAAATARQTLERFGIDPRAIDVVFRQVSAAEEQFQNKRTADAQRYTTAINQQQGSLGKILDTMTAIALAAGGVSEGVEGVTVWTNAVLGDLKGWETALRDTKDQSIQGLIDATIIWGRTTDTWVGQQIGKFAADVKAVTTDIKALYQFMKAEHDDVINRLNRKQGPEAKSGLEWIQDYMAGRVDFSGNPIPLGEQRKAIESFEQGEQGRAGGPAAPPPPLIEEKPPSAVISHPGRGAALPVPPTIETVGGQGPVVPAPAMVLRQAPPREESLATEPKRTLLDDISSAWDWLRGRNLGATAPAQFTTAATVGPETGKFVPDPEFLADHTSVMIEDRRAVEAQTTATQASTEEMQRLRDAFAAFEQPPPVVTTEVPAIELPPLVVEPQEQTPAPIVVPQAAAPAVVVEPAPIVIPQQGMAPAQQQPIIVPQSTPFDERFGEWQQQQSQLPSAFEGGAPIDLAGTGNPQQAAGERTQTAGGWLAASLLDRARDVNVNGTGKISVDVNAPAGTNVKAEGGGIFRRTEISRQVQMEPAEFGLSPTMG